MIDDDEVQENVPKNRNDDEVQENIPKFHRCTIGGIESKFTIESSLSVNIVSLGEFKRLRNRNFSFQTSDMIRSKVDDVEFLGHFTTNMEVCGKYRFVNFYMQNSSREFVILNGKMASHLELSFN